MKYYRYYRLLQLKKLSVTFAARYRLQIYSYIYNNNNNNNNNIYIYIPLSVRYSKNFPTENL